MSIIGAEYAARFGLPSNMVLMRGKPNASVLCDAQNVAETASSFVQLTSLDVKKQNNPAIDVRWRMGKSAKSVADCLVPRPIPLVNALQNAFQTMPGKEMRERQKNE
jgi:hypothetical protein